MDNKRIEVKINNVEYMLVTNEPEEYVQRVALLVNKKMGQIQQQNKQLSTAMTAVLAAINIADEYLKCEEALDNLRTELKSYAEETGTKGEELASKRLEVEKLKEDVHKLQIELAKKETELSSVRRNGPVGGSGYNRG